LWGYARTLEPSRSEKGKSVIHTSSIGKRAAFSHAALSEKSLERRGVGELG
jgi:hypothetical protein